MEMALRSQAGAALFLLIVGSASAQSWEFTAVQKRLWRDKPATVRIDASGIRAERKGESRAWQWDDIQQLTLTPDELRVLTYKDSTWRAGRDREWTFERLPKGQAEDLYSFLREVLDTRLVPALAVVPAQVLWETPVKLRRAFGGSEGTLIWGADSVAYRSDERDESRTWRIKDIEGVSSGDPFDLTITTSERQGLWRGGPSDFRFQLKRPMPDDRYQSLWRQVHRSKGLEILQSHRGTTN
jgi:hypothetical protein